MDLEALARAVLFVAAWSTATFFAVRLASGLLARRVAATATKVGDIVFGAVRPPLVLALALVGAWIAVAFGIVVLPSSWMAPARVSFFIAAGFVGAYTLTRLVVGFADHVAERRRTFRSVQPLVSFLARFVVYAIAAAIVLRSLGVDVTPLLGALGIGGLAIALALQDTLVNFFAGIYLTLDRPLREGEYVALEDGISGRVLGLGWRSVRLREPSEAIVTVPNRVVASGFVRNYTRADAETALTVDARIPLDRDAEAFERVARDVAREVQSGMPGAVAGFEPAVRWTRVDVDGFTLTATLRARGYRDPSDLRSEFLRRLARRLGETDAGTRVPRPAGPAREAAMRRAG